MSEFIGQPDPKRDQVVTETSVPTDPNFDEAVEELRKKILAGQEPGLRDASGETMTFEIRSDV